VRRDYLTPDQAAESLGWKGRKRGERLLRVMRAKEKRLGREIMVRLRKNIRTNYRLTEPMLKRWCPELYIDTTTDLVAGIGKQLSRLDERIEAIVDERVAPQLEELHAADAANAAATERLAVAVDCGFQAIHNRIRMLERPETSSGELVSGRR